MNSTAPPWKSIDVAPHFWISPRMRGLDWRERTSAGAETVLMTLRSAAGMTTERMKRYLAVSLLHERRSRATSGMILRP